MSIRAWTLCAARPAAPARPAGRHASGATQAGQARSRHGLARRGSLWRRLAPRLLVGVRLVRRSRGARGQPRWPGRHAAGSNRAALCIVAAGALVCGGGLTGLTVAGLTGHGATPPGATELTMVPPA
jgi:hypothetical protein